MIPVRLTISGFLSYREEAVLDFTGIHVACISGRNGAGKSAMLDAITWALFGEARKKDDSVINDHAELDTAKVSFEFRYEDTDFKINRQKTAGRSTQLEFYIRAADSEKWKPLTEKKVTDTEKRIRDILHMDYKTFINASFFLQGKADQFTGQNPTERKKILGNILNLEIWETYKAKASEKRRDTEKNALYIKGLIDEAEDELSREEILRSEYQAAKDRSETADRAYREIDEKWHAARAGDALLKHLRETAEQKKAEEEQHLNRIRDQQRILEDRRREKDTLQAGLANADAIEKDYRELLQVREALDRCTAAASQHAALENERVRLDSMIRSTENQLRFEFSQLSREKAELDRLLSEKQKLDAEHQAVLARVEKLSRECAALPELREKKEAVKLDGQSRSLALKETESKIRETEQKIENLLANRGGICPTCGREMDEEHCRTHAGELREEIAGLQSEKSRAEAEIRAKRVEYKELDTGVRALEDREKELNSGKIELGKCEQRLHNIEERLSQGQRSSARLAELEDLLKTGAFCTDERMKLSEVLDRIKELSYDRGEYEHLSREKSRLAGAEKRHMDLISWRSRIEPLEREIGEKESALADAEKRRQTLQQEREAAEKSYLEKKQELPDLHLIENERTRLNLERDRAGKELGQAEQRIRHLEDARKVMENRSAEYRAKDLEIRRYKDLEKAFGKDGIPALLIEQAIPEIEEQANKILEKLSGDTMSLQLITQGTYKSKKDEVKETLEILIKDLYGVREYEMYSGGEAFRINFSLRLALSRILARRAGSRLQTLVIDEGFGSQDEEGRARLAEAINAVQNDFEKILVITHLSELKEAFPSRIEVEKTEDGSRIEVIP